MSVKLDQVKQGLKTTGTWAGHVGALTGATLTIITVGEAAYNALMPIIRRRQVRHSNEMMTLNVIALKPPPLAPHPDQDNLMAG